jgi:putative flippase GtrA
MGTAIDVVLFALLRIRLGIPDLLANSAAYGAGTVNNFVFHRNWTFAGQQRKSLGRQFAQFVAVSAMALAVNNLLLILLENAFDALFATSEVGELLAKVCAMVAGMCLSFILQHTWTFRTHAPTSGYALIPPADVRSGSAEYGL